MDRTRPLPSQVPAGIETRLRRIGAEIEPALTAPLYQPLQQREPYNGAAVSRDRRYGSDARHLLDVFASSANAAPARTTAWWAST